MHKTIALISTCLLLFALTGPSVVEAQTASNLDCVERSKGQTLEWNSRWVRSADDQKVLYKVDAVRVTNVPPLRRVTIELTALELAKKKKRTMTIETEEKARAVCKSLRHTVAGPLKFPGENNTPFGDSNDPLSKPFIHYTQDGWVRAKAPAATARLSICRVYHREFSCLTEEKNRFVIMLRTVEEEIRWSGQ